MSNYKNNELPLNTICNSITNANISNFYKGLSIPSSSANFINGINEKPNNLGYSYENIDISEYCIAAYVESSGTQFTSIPSWCKKIRAILVGAGGNGASGAKGSNQRVDAVHHNYLNEHHHKNNANQNSANHNYDYDGGIDITYNVSNDENNRHNNTGNHNNKFNHQNTPAYDVQTNGAGGGGGGGGGFIYLDTTDIVGKSLQIQGGDSNKNTVLTIQTTAYTALGGNNANSTTLGTAGSTQGTTNINGTGKSGQNGQGANNTTKGLGGKAGLSIYSNTLSYGKGGDGSDGVGGLGTVIAGSSGQSGYYRIYFLTN
jgi:hypothetical protein